MSTVRPAPSKAPSVPPPPPPVSAGSAGPQGSPALLAQTPDPPPRRPEAVSTRPELPAGEGPSGTNPERFRRMAKNLETATENLVGGTDVALGVLTAFFSFGVSIRRLEGHIEPEEATALVDKARTLPPEDQRVLALALKEMKASGALHLHRPIKRGDGPSANAILGGFVDDTLAAGEATAADRALGSLLAQVDLVQIALSDTHTDLASAARKGRAVDPAQLELTEQRVRALRTALNRAPAPIRDAARALVREQLASHKWPANASQVPAMTQLRALVSGSDENVG